MSTDLLCLPNEILLAISHRIGAADRNALSQACRRLYFVVDPVLYRLFAALEPRILIDWSATYLRLQTIHKLIAYVSAQRVVIEQRHLDEMLSTSLRHSQYTIAEVLLRGGAEPSLFESCLRTSVGSLSVVASSRYHMTFWHVSSQPFLNERRFWLAKKRVVIGIIQKLQHQAFRGPKRPTAECLRVYFRELNSAFVYASLSDAHSLETMALLLRAGADVNSEVELPLRMNAVFNAADEEIPSLFRAKLRFLAENGATLDRALSWNGARTVPQHLFMKLSRDGSLSEKGSVTMMYNTIDAIQYTESLLIKYPARVGAQQPLLHPINAEFGALISSTDQERACLRQVLRQATRSPSESTEFVVQNKASRSTDMGFEYHRLEALWREWCDSKGHAAIV